MKNDNLNNSRRDFLRNLKNIGLGAGAASVAVFLGTKNELIKADKNIVVAGNCSYGSNCSGGGGSCSYGSSCGGR